MVKSKYLEKAVAIIMVAMLCLMALPQVFLAAEPAAYALKGTINSLVTIANEDVVWDGTTENGSIKIQLRGDGSGAKFSAYKLLDIAKNGDNRLKVSVPNDAQSFWKTYLGTNDTVTIGMIKAKLNGNGFANDAERSNSIVTTFLDGGFDPITATTTTTAGGTRATLNIPSFGFYIIQQTAAPAGSYIASAPVLACLPMQNNAGKWRSTYTVEPKDAEITINKQVRVKGETEYNKETIAEIGDTLEYEIVAKLAKYGSDITKGTIKYELVDELPTAIEYCNDGSAVVEFHNTTNATYEAIPGYTCTVDFDGANTLSVNLGGAGADYASRFANYDQVRIRYSAKLNQNNNTVNNIVIEGAGNPNTAKLTFTSAVGEAGQPSPENSIQSTAKVYTLELDITKVDNDDTSIHLKGATFQVYKNASDADDETKAIQFIDISGNPGYESGKHYRVATQAEIDAATNIVKSIVVSDTGEMKLYGLNNQHYHFKETVAPVGYNVPSELFEIAVQPQAADRAPDGSLQFDTIRQAEKIKNDSGINLPVTGGMGTILFTAIGLLLMAGAAYFLFAKKKESR